MKVRPIFFASFTIFIFFTAPASIAQTPPLLSSGQISQTPDALEIPLEQGRKILWPKVGSLIFKDSGGQTITQVDLHASARTMKATEALGTGVEEADLGGAQGKKKYLQGKKDPKGKSFNAQQIGQSVSAQDQGKSSESVAQGVPVTRWDFPNGSKSFRFQWGEAAEEVFFDAKNTLTSVQISRAAGPLQFVFKQWPDGSYSRSYKGSVGEVMSTYDAQEGGVRVTFANAQGVLLKEVNCREGCKVEE